jgi:hypothetical protein
MMLGYLQCLGCYAERLIVGPDERCLVAASEAETKQLPILGFFSTVNGRRVMFYRWDGVLRLRFG